MPPDRRGREPYAWGAMSSGMGRFRRLLDYATRGMLARRHTERWLTKHMAAPVPRIPARSEKEGGYDELRRTAEGRQWAEDFWNLTLDNLDPD